jgi:hypothetical protein
VYPPKIPWLSRIKYRRIPCPAAPPLHSKPLFSLTARPPVCTNLVGLNHPGCADVGVCESLHRATVLSKSHRLLSLSPACSNLDLESALTVVITWRAASLGGPLNAMSTPVTLDLVSSTNSSIVLRKMSANIQKVQKALQDPREKKYRSILQAALAHDVGKSTIAYRLHGRKPRAQSSSSSRRLTSKQEEALVRWVEDRQRQILPLNHTTLRELVVQLLQENDDFEPLGKLWTTRFI